MPQLGYFEELNGTNWTVWEITESLDEMTQLYRPDPILDQDFQHISNEDKQLEYLASRYLLKKLVEKMGEQYHGLYKDDEGKPYLLNSLSNISISHARGYAVAVFHRSQKVGVDIELMHRKLINTSDKFLSEEEKSYFNGDIAKLCISWSSKESIFKIIGKKGLSFKSNILINNFDLKSKGVVSAVVTTEKDHFDFLVNYQKISNHFVTVVTK